MHRHFFSIAAITLAGTTGCATPFENSANAIGSAMIVDRNGQDVGRAILYSQEGEVTLTASLDGFTQGAHAVHLHTFGDCSASDFTSAGGHLNPSGNEHGRLNPLGAHLGDLPNAEISAEGVGTISTILAGSSETVIAQIFDADGTALVVHEGADDYRSDPAGAAGSRVACGVFSRG